jgi:hypothetical protein
MKSDFYFTVRKDMKEGLLILVIESELGIFNYRTFTLCEP